MRMKRILAYILIIAMVMGNTVTASASGGVTVVNEAGSAMQTETVMDESQEGTIREGSVQEDSSEAGENAEDIVENDSSEEGEASEGTVENDGSEEGENTEETAENGGSEEGETTEGTGENEGTEEGETSEETAENDSTDEGTSAEETEEETPAEEETSREGDEEDTSTEEMLSLEPTEEMTSETEWLAEAEDADEEMQIPNVNLYSASEENGNYVLEGAYTTLQNALEAIDRLENPLAFYRIELVEATKGEVTDDTKELVFPSKAQKVTICADNELTEPFLYFKGNLKLKSNLHMEDLILVSASETAILLDDYELTLTHCRQEEESGGRIAAVKGSGVTGTSALILAGTALHVAGEVSKVGTIVFEKEETHIVSDPGTLIVDGKVQVGNIELETDGYLTGAAAVTRKKGKITKIKPQITIANEVYSTSGQTLYLDLREKVSGAYIMLDLDTDEAAQIRQKGIAFAKAEKVSYSDIKATQRNEAANLTKAGGYLTYFETGYGVVLSYIQDGEEIQIPCMNFSDAVTEINNRKTKQDYVITLTKDCAVTSGIRQDISKTIPQALTMPDKKYIRSLVIQAEEQAEERKTIELGFTGNITFTSDVTLRNVSFVQMVKSGSTYVKADVAKNDYPAALTVKSGGFNVDVEGNVTFNTPIVLHGGNKGTLTLDESSLLYTFTNNFKGPEEEAELLLYGSVTGWKNLTVNRVNLNILEYRTGRYSKAYKASTNKITSLMIKDGSVKIIGDNAKGALTVQNLDVDNGELYVGGKLTIKNATLEGTQKATLFADANFTITGTLTSKSNNATLLTRLKGAKKAPYLNISGMVVREAGIKPVYVGVYPEINASVAVRNKAVALTDAPKTTAQLLTAKKALAVDFRPIAENYPSGSGEYHQDNTSGYMMLKSGSNIYVYDGSKVKIAVYVKDSSYTGGDDGQLFGFFPSIKNATSAVNAKKDRNAVYTYVLMEANGNMTSPVSVSLPSYAKQVVIKSIPECHVETKTITFTGNISLMSDTVLEDIILAPVKNKKAVNVIINGKNKALTLKGTDIPGTIKAVSVLTVNEDAQIRGDIAASLLCLENTQKKEAVTLSVGGAVTVADLVNYGETANVLAYTRTSKNAPNLTITGTITNENPAEKVILRQVDDTNVKLLSKEGNKVNLSSQAKIAVMEKATTDSFVLENTSFVQEPGIVSLSDVILVKASKGVYAVKQTDSEILRNLVTLEEKDEIHSSETRCLDYTQAINEINNRGHISSSYRILFETEDEKPVDTGLTDKYSYSAMPLPKKNKAAGVTIQAAFEEKVAIAYTGKISGYGNIIFKNLKLTSVKSGNNEAVGKSSLAVASDKIGANFTFDHCGDICFSEGIQVADALILYDTKVLSDKAVTIKNLVMDATSSLDCLGKLTLTQATVPETVNTSYVGIRQNAKGVPQFTMKTDVSGGMLQVKVYKHTVSATDGNDILEGNCEQETESYLDVSLVKTENGTPEKFRAYPYRIVSSNGTLSDNADGVTKDNLVAYKKGNYIKNGTAESMLTALGMSELLTAAADAGEELEKLAQDKTMFALVYLTDAYEVKETPSLKSATIVELNSAHTVQIIGMEAEWQYMEEQDEYVATVWYYVQFYVGDTLYRGYIEEAYLAYSDEVLLQWKSNWTQLFPEWKNVEMMGTGVAPYADVEQFPTSYQVHLNKLKSSHANWIFVPMNVGRNWDACVDEQMGDYSWIYYNQPAEFRGAQINSTWYYASRAGIAYYMDPRNFLTESNIFQFEQNTYNASYHTQSALQSFLNNTFMAGKVPDDSAGRTYANIIWNSGKDRGLSPFNLAARVIQEQGINGSSSMISGTYPGYEGLYNFYNIGASGTTDAEVLKNGLTHARKQGWTTRVKSLNGGAAFIGNNYILQGQDTLYLQKFDVEHGSSALHQYMQNIMAPYTEGRSMKTMYTNAGSLNSGFVFKIPVFDNMPGANYTISHKSVKIEKGKTKQIAVLRDGIKVSADKVVFVSADKTIATVSSAGVITAVKSGKTIVTATVGEGDDKIQLTCKVEVYAPLKSISLSAGATDLYMADSLADRIPYLDENGVTKYLDKADCPTQTTLTVAYNPEDTTDDRTVKWIVDNPEIVTITQDESDVAKAVVTAKNGGSTKITAKVGKCTAQVTVTVRVPMTEAALKTDENLILYKGQSTKVNVSYLPYQTTDAIDPVFLSKNESVVQIVDGELVAVGPGTTTVQAAVGPFDGTQAALTCKVTVKEYRVTFMNADGSVLLSLPGEYGSKLETLESEAELPWTMNRDGALFMGWYTEEGGNGYAVDSQTILYGDMILYPYFEDVSTGFYVKPIGNMDYTGAYLKPAVEVYNGETLLRKGIDYFVTYENNKFVNNSSEPVLQPKAIVHGKKEFAGTVVDAEFNIVPKDISHTDVSAGNLIVKYTGKEQQLRPVLYDGGRTLQWKVDYELSYPEDENENGAYSEAGTYAVEVTGCGNYTGSRTVHVSISKRTLLSAVKISSIKDAKFNNGKAYESEEDITECRPVVSLSDNERKLVENTDYTVRYENNREIGIGTVVINGMGDYIGKVEKQFRITGSNLSTVTVKGLTSHEYTGEPILQDGAAVKVVNKNKDVLREGLDYQLSFENNTSAGKAYLVITGINGYSGEIKVPFTITAYNIEDNNQTYDVSGNGETTVSKPAFEVMLEDSEAEYDKAGTEAGVYVSFKGNKLQENVDYKLSYKNKETDASGEWNRSVMITGIGNFSGVVTRDFSIQEKDLTKVSMAVENVMFRNRKGYCFVKPVLTDESGRRLVAGTDYEEQLCYTYAENTMLYNGESREAGETVLPDDIPVAGTKIYVTAIGKDYYSGTVTGEYEVLESTSWF